MVQAPDRDDFHLRSTRQLGGHPEPGPGLTGDVVPPSWIDRYQFPVQLIRCGLTGEQQQWTDTIQLFLSVFSPDAEQGSVDLYAHT